MHLEPHHASEEAADINDLDTSDLSTAGKSSTVSNLYPLPASALAAQLDKRRQVASSDLSTHEYTRRSSPHSSTHLKDHSFIDLVHTSMNSSRAGSTGHTSRTPSEGGHHQSQHARQESGYQSSTIGTNSIPPMTIGVKRGSDLLASRRGPQITGQTFTTAPTPTRAGSAPPHTGVPGHNHSQSTSGPNIQEIFDYNEYHQRASEFNAIIDSGKIPTFKPIYVGEELQAEDDDEDSQHDLERRNNNNNDNEESEDDGIEPAENYKEEMESQVDNYRLPDDADPALSVLNKSQSHHQQQQQQPAQQPFYQLQHDDGNRSPLSACSEPRGQLLSTEALAARMLYGIDDNYQPIDPNGPMALAHNEAMRQHQKALLDRRENNSNNDNSNALLGIPKVKKVSSGTLGSPFNQQQQQLATGAPGATGTSAIGVQTVPIIKQPTPKRLSSRDKTNLTSVSASGRHRQDKNLSNSNLSKQAFPSKSGDDSMDSLVITLTGAGVGSGRKDPSSRNKKPPSSNARYNTGNSTTVRGRKSSDASERSVKKDDLLGKLSDALRAEKRLVKLYQDELQSAEAQMAKILEAEATRDEEMSRLESRHARDKQLISALKLKVERLETELMRAEDVPEHEAEAYLDLLSGAGGASGAKKHLTFENDSSTVDYDEDDLDRDSNAEERSMRALVEEQDALDGTWTKQMMEKEDKRRKAFAKKRKQHLAGMNDSSATEDENLVEARLAEAQAQALAQAGLDQRPNHTRKLSFKDTLKRTFGMKPSNEDRVNIMRYDSAPAATALPASNATNIPAPTPTKYTTGPDLARTVSSPPPTIGLPPIPVDPSVNAKDAKAQHKRLTKLASEKNNHLKPGMPDGTYGRSASMDVPQGTPFYTPVTLSETALPLSGYSSDSDVTKTGKNGGKGLTGLFRMDRPPASNNTRYGVGIEGVRPSIGRARKLSWGRTGSSNSDGGNVSSGGSGGFFKHRNFSQY